MNRFIAALLRIALSSLPVALGHPALAGADTLGIAAVSAANMVAVPITAAHAVAAEPAPHEWAICGLQLPPRIRVAFPGHPPEQ